MQNYVTGAEDEYVILGNTAVMKCKVPSFVADFISVESWISSDGQEYRRFDDGYGRVTETGVGCNGTFDVCTWKKIPSFFISKSVLNTTPRAFYLMLSSA